jgi:DNA-directed RNA polymerase specialized sigma24 family protein
MAEVQAVPVGTVKSRLHRALEISNDPNTTGDDA